jgi:hypothetical protein
MIEPLYFFPSRGAYDTQGDPTTTRRIKEPLFHAANQRDGDWPPGQAPKKEQLAARQALE